MRRRAWIRRLFLTSTRHRALQICGLHASRLAWAPCASKDASGYKSVAGVTRCRREGERWGLRFIRT